MRDGPTVGAQIRRHIASTLKDHPGASLERVTDLVFAELVENLPITRATVRAELAKVHGLASA